MHGRGCEAEARALLQRQRYLIQRSTRTATTWAENDGLWRVVNLEFGSSGAGPANVSSTESTLGNVTARAAAVCNRVKPGDGGTESPPVSTASSSVKAPSGGRAWSATEMHSLVEVE